MMSLGLFASNDADARYRNLVRLASRFLGFENCSDAEFIGSFLAKWIIIIQDDISNLWQRIVEDKTIDLHEILMRLHRCGFINDSLLLRSIQRWLFVSENIPLSFLLELSKKLSGYDYWLIQEIIEYLTRRKSYADSQTYSQGYSDKLYIGDDARPHIDLEYALDTFSEDRLLLLLQTASDLDEHAARRVINKLRSDSSLEKAERLCERRWPNVVEDVKERREDINNETREYYRAILGNLEEQGQPREMSQAYPRQSQPERGGSWASPRVLAQEDHTLEQSEGRAHGKTHG